MKTIQCPGIALINIFLFFWKCSNRFGKKSSYSKIMTQIGNLFCASKWIAKNWKYFLFRVITWIQKWAIAVFNSFVKDTYSLSLSYKSWISPTYAVLILFDAEFEPRGRFADCIGCFWKKHIFLAPTSYLVSQTREQLTYLINRFSSLTSKSL